MSFDLFVYLMATLVGVSGGLMAWLLPASGKAALGLCLVPLAGVGLTMAFC